MELKVTSSREEVLATAIRMHFRVGDFRSNRIKESLWAMLWGVIGVVVMTGLFKQELPPWWLIPLVCPIAFGVVYWTHRDTVIRRIRRYVEKNCRDGESWEVVYRVADSKFHYTEMGVEHIVSLNCLTWVGEDEEYLDICFDKKLYAVIPQSVFVDEKQKKGFLNALGAGEVRDLPHVEGAISVKNSGNLRQGYPQSVRLGMMISIPSVLVGIVLLIALSYSGIPLQGWWFPMGVIGLAMVLFGLLLGIGILVWNSRSSR